MKKKGKKKRNKLFLKKRSPTKQVKTISMLQVLFILFLLGLFSESVRTIPAGALNDRLINISLEVPKLHSDLIQKKYLLDPLLINNNKVNSKKIENLIIPRKEKIIEKKTRNNCSKNI